jgi:hypothetical protein
VEALKEELSRAQAASKIGLRRTYSDRAISQIPRILSCQDRNPYSPTYGCMHRDYWMYKTSDFPDMVRQFGVQALALVYKHDFPGSIYQGKAKICDYALAAIDYWVSQQHLDDGSFDEFYPYERGWVGPTAFTSFAVAEALQTLRPEVPKALEDRTLVALRKAAYFIVEGDKEEDHLANHHAMACLAVWKVYRLLDEPALKSGFEKLFEGFLKYHNGREGWSREYDGVDPGYLSATVSFFGKVYPTNPDAKIFEVLQQSVNFCKYFVYPNGFYAGSTGSRNTLHFYAHGFEVLADRIPMAAAIAEKMLIGLGEDKLVPPEIMSDRYLFYRVPEFLQAYLDYKPRPDNLPALPYEEPSQRQYFPEGRIFTETSGAHYVICNLAKGGVTKVFDRASGALLLNDCGLIGRLEDGRTVTSQWVDPEFKCSSDEKAWEVAGQLHVVPSNKLFTLFKNLLFRSALLALGWVPAFAHQLKGGIRKSMMLGRRPVPVNFRRRFERTDAGMSLTDEIWIDGPVKIAALSVGDEFFVRYVPQSRYFQSQELDVAASRLTAQQVAALNNGQRVTIRQQFNAASGKFQAGSTQ